MKSCKKGYYYCFTDKECKKIPKGWHLMSSGQIMRDKDHEEDSEDKSGNDSNGSGNGGSDAGGDGGGGGGVEESWSVTNEGKESGDHEVAMAQSQLAKAERNIAKLRKALGKKEKDIPAWMQAKITDTAHDTDAAAGYADKINEAVPLLAAPLAVPTMKAIGAGLAATGLAGMIMQARKKSEDKKSQSVDYGQGKSAKNKDNTEIGFTGKPIPKKNWKSPTKRYDFEKKRREAGFTSTGTKYSNDVNPYFNPRVREEVEQLEEARDGKSAKDKGYSLRDWFKGGGWKQTGGKYDGKPCAKQPGQKTKPFCRDADDRAAMSKDEREKRAKKKRKEDPNPNRKGKAKMVTEEGKKDACYHKVKSRYSVWPSAYASGALVKCRKVGAKNWGNKINKESYDYSNWRDDFKTMEFEFVDIIKTEPMKGLSEAKSTLDKLKEVSKQLKGASKMHAKQSKVVAKCVDELDEAKKCWPGYEKKGTKKMFGKTYNNCVKKEEFESVSEAKLGKCEKNKIEEYVKGMKKNKGSFKDNYGADAKPVMYATATNMAKKACKEEVSDWRSELDLQEKKMKNCGCGQNPCKTYGKQEVKEDWQKSNRKDGVDGMSQKAVNAYRRENPGSKLKTAVTGNPKKGSKDAKRRKSFCARSKGQQDMHNINCAKTPDKSICKARRRWKC